MGSIFRSEEMQLSQLIMHTDIAYMCISELGELGLVQFRDNVSNSNAFQRKFVTEVRRCHEMDRQLRFFEKEIQKDKFSISNDDTNPEASTPREMIILEAIFEKLENELLEAISSSQQLMKTYLELSELKQILEKIQLLFDEGSGLPSDDRTYIQDLSEDLSSHDAEQVKFLTGLMSRDRFHSFERMLWRVCRGNVFLKQAEVDETLEDTTVGSNIPKSVFLVLFQGDELRSRVMKICDGFHATIYPCPDSQSDRHNMLIDVKRKIEDLETVLTQTKQHRQRILETATTNLRCWFVQVRKTKAIYHTLNLFNLDVTTKCMVGECWCAVSDVDKIHLALRRGMERSNSTLQPILNGIATQENPPTYHRTNKFTHAFQNIINAYGVAQYREVNPALFTVITFPFLFAVMFGDAGHGLLMFLFGLWMVIGERKMMAKKSKNEIWNIFFGGRYIVLLMGLFSIYTGLIYNDIFSRAANIFGSSWYPTYDNRTIMANTQLQLEPRVSVKNCMFSGYPYAFGLDPVWQLANNEITLTNSIKMKMSIVLGVIHMLAGVCLGAFNYRQNKDMLSIWCQLIPQIIFLSSIFLYLVILIFYKWIAFTSDDASKAPSLLIGLINMVRFDYPEPPDLNAPFYSGQKYVQICLVILAVICVPWMLLSKPLILRMRHRAIVKRAVHCASENEIVNIPVNVDGPANNEDVENSGGIDVNGSTGRNSVVPNTPSECLSNTSHTSQLSSSAVDPVAVPKFNFGDIMIHQSIHTIEYCLGCISNTASYLRLWALSLAHAQLSEVLWTMVMKMGLGTQGYYGGAVLVPIFAFWAILTISILLLMEGLSAFLHTLRLHWVEFQNKFYSGDGYPFTPFSFKRDFSTTSENITPIINDGN